MDNEQTVPGHECNMRCKPDEGLHCHLSHLWQVQGYGRLLSLDEAIYRANVLSTEVHLGDQRYPFAYAEAAGPEVPPETADEANAKAIANGIPPIPPWSRYIGPVLNFFRVPVEVKA